MTKYNKQRIGFLLIAVITVSFMLCACGGQTPETETVSMPAPTEETAAIAATEVKLAETEPVETAPVETVPPETEPVFITVNDVSYDSRLGEPVLGEEAVKQLAKARDHAAAAEQINNVGDAVYYMKAARNISDGADLFMTLLANDYDEIGLIELSSSTARNHYVYIGQDGVFYPFNPGDIPEGIGILWPEVPKFDTDLDALCEKMMETCPYTRDGNPMTTYGSVALYGSELINVNGIPYASVLGEPVLGEATVAELVKNGDIAAAAEQIANAGDAIYYMQAVRLQRTPDALLIACNLFAGLLGNDYDEIGLISLETSNSNYSFVYIVQDGVYTQFDPWSMCSGGPGFMTSAPAVHTDLDTLCEKMLSTCAYIQRDDPVTFYTTRLQYTRKAPATQKEKVVSYLTTPQYTKEQITQWVAEGLTVEQWAEKIKVPADAVQLLGAIDYLEKEPDPQDNVGFQDRDTGIHWVGIWNAYEVFAHRAGNCGGVSSLMNFLLAGDVEDQGYVQFTTIEGGHIFNYFVYDGIYVMCDFTRLFGPYLGAFPNTSGYIEYAGPSIQEFSDYYLYKSHFTANFFTPDHDDYLFGLYLYPQEGPILPSGDDWPGRRTSSSKGAGRILPEEYKDLFGILYEDENNPFRFHSIPPMDEWPDTIK